MNGTIVGIIGTGRLGGALARRLPRHLDLRLTDIVAERANEVAMQIGKRANAIQDVFREASVVLLTLPPDAVVPVVSEYGHLLRRDSWLINMATSVPTHQVRSI